MVLKNVLEGSGKESTPAETLNGYLRRAIKFVTQNHTPKGCLIVCVLSELALTEPSGLQRLRRMLAVNERIVSLQLKGVGFEGDCETAAKIASTLVTGFAVRARSGETRASLLKNVSPAAALVMNACGGKAA